jgi:hypothetical protein
MRKTLLLLLLCSTVKLHAQNNTVSSGGQPSGSGYQSKPATSLPDWAKQFPCLSGVVALGQGDVATIFDEKNKIPVELYKDGKAKDLSGYMGTWACDGNQLTINMTRTIFNQNKVTSGFSSDKGAFYNKCDQSTFPDCLKGFNWDGNFCNYSSSAYDVEKNKYTVVYYNNPTKTSTGVDAFYCTVIKQGLQPFPGQYLCSGTLPQIYSQFGVLEAANEGVRREIPSVTQSDMENIPGLLMFDNSGQHLTSIDIPKLNQVVAEILDLISNQYQGLDIGYLILFLQKAEKLANYDGLTEESKLLRGALDRFENALTIIKNKNPNYTPTVNPTSQELKFFSKQVKNVSYLKNNFTIYRKKYQVDGSEDCKECLEAYLVKINLGYLLDVNTVPLGANHLSEVDLIEIIKSCRNNMRYVQGKLGKNKKYAKAINFLGKESPSRGGIDFSSED